MALLKMIVKHTPPTTEVRCYLPMIDDTGVMDIPIGVLYVETWTWSVLRTKCFDNPSIEVVE